MVLDMHSSIAEGDRGGRIEAIVRADGGKGPGDSAVKDFLPRLGAMRRLVDAAGSAVYACPAIGTLAGTHMSLVLSDGDYGMAGITSGSESGRALLAHCERSVRPAIWSPAARASAKATSPLGIVARLELEKAPVAGLVLPVRIGGLGNGLIVFEDAYSRLSAGSIFAVHRMAYRLMADIFRIEIGRSTPKQSLSERELECLQLAGDGCKSEGIADCLGLSVHTVNAYLGTATAKLDSVNRIQAIAKAIRLGLIA